MSKTVLIATIKPFSTSARDQTAAVFKEAGYSVRLLESYGDQSDLIAAVADVDAMIVRSDKIDAEVLDAAKQLKLVVRAGAGYDAIDCTAAKDRGVAVMNTPGQNANAVAELALAMMVYLARGKFNGKPGTELRDKTLGIHAYGAVGRAVHAVAKGFGMKVLAYDAYVSASDIEAGGATPVKTVEELYKQSNYVSLHIPATDETRNSIGKALLSLMPEGGTLVNTARKEVINEPELIEALTERSDLRYITDIAPSAETKAVLEDKLAAQVYMTPKKMGAQTGEANVNAGTQGAKQIVGFLDRGERLNVVND
ncbi:MAG: 3-phosphoglycerate dehydrogenase [Deltaproteobacteria bacterium]|nr:3-phosphoglycerate dehydrogenase [Deltaproteobacteria bacterium]